MVNDIYKINDIYVHYFLDKHGKHDYLEINDNINKEGDMNEREYDLINNEGGDGYNPYRAKRERKEHEEAQQEARRYAQTPQGRIDGLYRRIDTECGSVAREWGNNAEIDDLQSSLYVEIDKIKAEMDDEFLAIWTIDITKSRRIEWNDFVNTTLKPLGSYGDPAMMRKLYVRQKDQGWSLDDLKKAIKAHNL